MKEIAVSGGLVAKVDDIDFERVARHKWQKLSVRGSLTTYARTTVSKKTVYLHRMILDAPTGMEVDHIDGDGLNNTRQNLRVVSHQKNIQAITSRRQFAEWFERYQAKTRT